MEYLIGSVTVITFFTAYNNLFSTSDPQTLLNGSYFPVPDEYRSVQWYPAAVFTWFTAYIIFSNDNSYRQLEHAFLITM